MRGSVFIIEDDRESADLLAAGVKRHGFDVEVQLNPEEAFARVLQSDFDVVLTDLLMPGLSGLELCDRLAANRPDLPVVVVTGHATVDSAVAAIRAGAYDFVTKPIDAQALALVLERAVRHRLLREEVKRLRRVLQHTSAVDDVVGESPALRRVYDLIDRVADTDATVLITGESGTGKEMAARALHARSRRAHGPFVAVNCAAMPEALLESELFGHARGAFTDARVTRSGLFVRADGGTLFLDEIGELPLGLQPKLLRALQERKVRPVGSDQEIPFNARIIAATNVDVEQQVKSGRFREDLYYRLNVIALEMPPLRSRGKDVLLLAQRFVQQFAARRGKNVVGLSPAAAERLLTYHWPGNIRELHNCIERAVALTSFEQITVEDLPEKIRNYRGWQMLTSRAGMQELVPMAELERRYILHVLEVVGGSRTLAARTLGMDRKTLYRRLEMYGVNADGTPRKHATSA
ncbi:MAG: sigma-54-dependent Fis family transcriptional regulator [Myxococcaceae bacterium]|nr:sigma-54-dependent Fis family transcriptional regulator [Myxococcaceae bacterium]